MVGPQLSRASRCPALLPIPRLLAHYEVPDSTQKQVPSACVGGGLQKCRGEWNNFRDSYGGGVGQMLTILPSVPCSSYITI